VCIWRLQPTLIISLVRNQTYPVWQPIAKILVYKHTRSRHKHHAVDTHTHTHTHTVVLTSLNSHLQFKQAHFAWFLSMP